MSKVFPCQEFTSRFWITSSSSQTFFTWDEKWKFVNPPGASDFKSDLWKRLECRALTCSISIKNFSSQCVLLFLSPLCLMRPCMMRMKWRLFSLSLKVNMAIPPIPEFSFSDVRIELTVSAQSESRSSESLSFFQRKPTLLHCMNPWHKLTSEQRPVFDYFPLQFSPSTPRRGHADAHLFGLQLSQERLGHVLPHSTDLQKNTHAGTVWCFCGPAENIYPQKKCFWIFQLLKSNQIKPHENIKSALKFWLQGLNSKPRLLQTRERKCGCLPAPHNFGFMGNLYSN